MISNGNGSRSIPQGLKPIEFIGFIGTTEVVPCYKASEMQFSAGCASEMEFFRRLCINEFPARVRR
jgi:hypothetical protein